MNTEKKRKPTNIKRIISLCLLFIFSGIAYSFGVVTYEQIKVNKLAKDFKARAVFDFQTEDSRGNVIRMYYKVERTHDYELLDTRNVFFNESKTSVGQKGDVYLTRQSPFPFIPVFHQFMSHYFGGHVAINTGRNTFYEALGFPDEGETPWDSIITRPNQGSHLTTQASESGSNYWLSRTFNSESSKEYPYFGTFYRTEFFGLRAKYVTEEQIDLTLEYARSLVDVALYNFLFFLDMEGKYYCVDMVTRAYQYGLNDTFRNNHYATRLNDDGFISTVQDIILSKDMYMTTYVEVIDNIQHIYYLEDVL